MLHILFLILKIIGIILLVILGILILLLCAVLFIPVRYQVKAVSEGNKEHMRAEAKVSWFLHLVSAFAGFDGKQLRWKVRIVWKTLSQETLNKSEEISGEIEGNPDGIQVEEAIEETTDESVDESGDESKKDVVDEVQIEKEASEERTSVDGKKKWYEKIKYTFQSICDKIKMCFETKEKIVTFLENEVHQQAFLKIKKEIFWLLKHLRPKEVKGKVRFGFDDPCRTGQVLAGLSVLYPFYGENVEIEPDFENEILTGNLFIKGYIRGITLITPIWKLVWNKHVRATYKAIKNWKR